ncbi:PREDICTED: uncharacterized protein LOC109163273 [Ipomoea nil]|uniref:uncharacterized protein LOC109163273 n=1 Tax=Ipomoea nil TaxID=35883 RepID=UPI000900D220|nr:PREDICTED: uncharacterized protein LOC109163273 [Ipomoea nil]
MGMQVEALTDELFLFRFPHSKDLQMIIDDDPWSFENHTLVCERVLSESRPEDVELESVAFWVQIHGLPAMYASSEFLNRIGDYLGSFVAIDPNNFGGSWKGFYRIRARMLVGVPLKRRMKLVRKDGSTQWINFCYERLNAFCFCCGVLGDIDKFCRNAYEDGIPPESFPFDSWMRAETRRQAKPVGAKWLLLKDAPLNTTPSTPGPSPLALVSVQESTGLHGELKRRRESAEVHNGVTGEDVLMSKSSKNLLSAGLKCPQLELPGFGWHPDSSRVIGHSV